MHNALDRQDRRRGQRLQVTLPVELTDGTAVTRDLSACGVFFETSRAFVPGECIQFTLILEHVDPGHQVRLSCRGRVVRVEPCSKGLGVAVAITAYRIDARGHESGGIREVDDAHGSSRSVDRREETLTAIMWDHTSPLAWA